MATLEYNFRIVGLAAVKRALASVEKSFAQHNARMSKQAGIRGGGRSPRSQGAATARAQDRTHQKATRDQQRQQQQRLRGIERASAKERRDKERLHQQSMRQIRRESAAAAKGRARVARNLGGTVGRSATGAGVQRGLHGF